MPADHMNHQFADGDHRDGSGLERLLGKFGGRGTLIVGLLCSASLHLLLVILAALVLVGGGGPAGEGDRPPGAVELAVVTQTELAAMQSQASLPTLPVPAFEPSADEALESIELAELDATRSDVSVSERAMESLGAGDVTGGAELATGGGGSGTASFFGAEAVGRRIAYAVDVSGSMAGGGRIDALEAELSRSIRELRSPMEFFVALYNSGGFPLPGFREWTEASPALTREARRAFAHVRTEVGGGTEPVHAFDLIASLRPPPDAIFFMTDGDFDDLEAQRIIDRFRPTEIPIHCVTFISSDGAERMQAIADATGGTYTHVDSVRRGR